eukprot:gene7897-12365_t
MIGSFILFGLLLLVVYLSYQYVKYLEACSKLRDIPGITSFFRIPYLLGSESPFKTQVTKKNAKQYGDMFKYTLGSSNILFLTNPEDIKKMLLTDIKKFGKPDFLKSQKGPVHKVPNMIRLDTNDDWKRVRSLSSTAFSDSNLKYEFESNVDKVTDDLMNSWNEIALKNGVINASKDFGFLTLDVIGISGFGKEFKTIEEKDDTYANIISTLFGSLVYKSALPSFLFKLPIPFFQKMLNAEERWAGYLNQIINQRRKDILEAEKQGFAFNKTDLLSKMMVSHVEDENPFTHDELIANTHLFLVAGHETTANTLSWIFYFLALYPKYQDMINKEAIEEFGDETKLSFEKLSKGFPITKAVINETLRLKNPASGALRSLLTDYTIRGHVIPKDTLVVASFLAVGMNKNIWGNDVDDFKPERFLNRDMKDLRYVFSPFSSGPRVCIGKRFAEMEMILIIAKAMMKFRIHATEELKNVDEVTAGTMRPSIPIKVNISLK